MPAHRRNAARPVARRVYRRAALLSPVLDGEMDDAADQRVAIRQHLTKGRFRPWIPPSLPYDCDTLRFILLVTQGAQRVNHSRPTSSPREAPAERSRAVDAHDVGDSRGIRPAARVATGPHHRDGCVGDGSGCSSIPGCSRGVASFAAEALYYAFFAKSFDGRLECAAWTRAPAASPTT